MTDLDSFPFAPPVDDDWPPTPVVEREPRKCRRHQWSAPGLYVERAVVTERTVNGESGHYEPMDFDPRVRCLRCGRLQDATRVRRGKQSRNYGNRAELEAARRYGGQKVGAAGGPVDIRGTDWNTQMKTHRRKPPVEWTTAFGKMTANRERMPRLLLRFVMGQGTPPQDYFVVRGEDWLAWHGKDGGE